MKIAFAHLNIIAQDWKSLASFYKNVFLCVEVPPTRKLSGKWLEEGTGVKEAELEGVHLRLPGFKDEGPTLEIYTYSVVLEKQPSMVNRKGFGHIAFVVDDVKAIVNKVLDLGGGLVGEITKTEVPGVGELTFVYCSDPEDNIIEIQNWKKRCVREQSSKY